MIVKMKKCTVICLLEEKEAALKALREVGVLHVEAAELAESEDRAVLGVRLLEAQHAGNVLSAIKTKAKPDKAKSSTSGKDLCLQILDLEKEKIQLTKDLEHLENNKGLLAPWGEFSPELLQSLKTHDVQVYLCEGTQSDLDELPEDVTCMVIKSGKHRVYFAVISNQKIEAGVLPLAQYPKEKSLSEITTGIEDIKKQLREIDEKLLTLIPKKTELDEYTRNLEEQIEFTSNRDGMLEAGAVACINGYCPVPEIKNLEEAAQKHGWGLWLTNPTQDDDPPTLIKIPKALNFSKALFGFIGISPGYKEWDTSICFLLFFTLFVSMIVGDAGYGLIFLITAIFAKKKIKGSINLQRWINLFIFLSCATIVWGFVNGNYFAIPAKYLPNWMQGFEWFTNPDLKDKHLMLLCFLIAAIHLSFARFWKAYLAINSTKGLGQIGWGLILWGNFFVARKLIVYPNSEWPFIIISILYGLGLFFVIAFGVNWKKMDEGFGFIFGMSGTFVDLLSYIRLFAVGLSSYYIAKSFNDMGVMVFGISSHVIAIPFLVIGMIIVMLFGHVLNVMLAMLGVLVHGIRLNTLEFSNHMGLQWLGHLYKPFKKQKD